MPAAAHDRAVAHARGAKGANKGGGVGNAGGACVNVSGRDTPTPPGPGRTPMLKVVATAPSSGAVAPQGETPRRRRLLGGPALGEAGARRRTAALRATLGATSWKRGSAAQEPLPGEEPGPPVSGVSIQQGRPRRRQLARIAAAGPPAVLADPCGSLCRRGQPRSSSEERRRAGPFRATAPSGARRPSSEGAGPVPGRCSFSTVKRVPE